MEVRDLIPPSFSRDHDETFFIFFDTDGILDFLYFGEF